MCSQMFNEKSNFGCVTQSIVKYHNLSQSIVKYRKVVSISTALCNTCLFLSHDKTTKLLIRGHLALVSPFEKAVLLFRQLKAVRKIKSFVRCNLMR